jgi:hypothetical protein
MGTAYRLYGLRLSDGARGVPAVEREIVGALPPGTTYSFHITSVVEGQVDRAVKPEAIALAVFGIIAMAAALLIAVQAIARQLQARDEDIGVLRALGASPAMTMGEGLVGILGAVVLGSLLAAGVAIGLSPLSPIGPVRPVYPAPDAPGRWAHQMSVAGLFACRQAGQLCAGSGDQFLVGVCVAGQAPAAVGCLGQQHPGPAG